MSADIKKRSIALVGQVDERELTIRIIEAMGHCKRPAGMTFAQIMAVTPPDVATGARDCARAALTYIAECLAKGEKPN